MGSRPPCQPSAHPSICPPTRPLIKQPAGSRSEGGGGRPAATTRCTNCKNNGLYNNFAVIPPLALTDTRVATWTADTTKDKIYCRSTCMFSVGWAFRSFFFWIGETPGGTSFAERPWTVDSVLFRSDSHTERGATGYFFAPVSRSNNTSPPKLIAPNPAATPLC